MKKGILFLPKINYENWSEKNGKKKSNGTFGNNKWINENYKLWTN